MFVGRSSASRIARYVLASVLVVCGIHSSELGFVRAEEPSGKVLTRIKVDGHIRLGMYLNFEGLSFRERGHLIGLEVELAKLLGEELSRELGTPVQPEIVNQEWSQIIKVLRDGKYDAVMSAVIPSMMYSGSHVRFSRSYLDTGPIICTQEIEGNPAKGVTEKVDSLAGKRVVVINDPAVRRVLRRAGVYVPADEHIKQLERGFPRSATEAEVAKVGGQVPLVAVKEILQIDEMPMIYEMLADGKVDAGVIDLGIIWWVSTKSPRWASRIHAFTRPVGPYIYSVTTRVEDVQLGDAVDKAVARLRERPEYEGILLKWHGTEPFQWKLTPDEFLQ